MIIIWILLVKQLVSVVLLDTGWKMNHVWFCVCLQPTAKLEATPSWLWRICSDLSSGFMTRRPNGSTVSRSAAWGLHGVLQRFVWRRSLELQLPLTYFRSTLRSENALLLQSSGAGTTSLSAASRTRPPSLTPVHLLMQIYTLPFIFPPLVSVVLIPYLLEAGSVLTLEDLGCK